MKKEETRHNVAIDIETSLRLPQLEDLTQVDLLDLFIRVSKQFVEGIQNSAGIEHLDALHLKISTIKDEIHRKKNLSWGINHG